LYREQNNRKQHKNVTLPFFLMIVKGTCTVLCKSNAHVFRQNLWLFLAFQQKNIEFSIEGNFL